MYSSYRKEQYATKKWPKMPQYYQIVFHGEKLWGDQVPKYDRIQCVQILIMCCKAPWEGMLVCCAWR